MGDVQLLASCLNSTWHEGYYNKTHKHVVNCPSKSTRVPLICCEHRWCIDFDSAVLTFLHNKTIYSVVTQVVP